MRINIPRKINLYKTLAFVLAAAIITEAAFIGVKACRTASVAAMDWGMSYQTEGAPPVGNATYEYLEQYDARFYEKTEEKCVYLTFDAGYENGYTEDILDTLKENDVTAAFFLVGHYFETCPEIVKRMAAEGHVISNHTMTHPDASVLSKGELEKQLESVNELCEQTAGVRADSFFRPPSGKFSEEMLTYAKELGYKTIFWSVAYVDWKNDDQPDEEDALAVLNSRVHNGAIILLHSTSATNCLILDRFIKELKSEGYTFKSLRELAF